LDGSLTGLGPNTYATFAYNHLINENCNYDEDLNGVKCDSSVKIRRVAFDRYTPNAIFDGMGLKLLRYDDDYVASLPDKDAYILDKSNYGTAIWQPYSSDKRYAVSLVTGHKYKIHWGQTGIDFETIHAEISEKWEPTDAPVYLVHNYTDSR
jgi:hypothetical protein